MNARPSSSMPPAHPDTTTTLGSTMLQFTGERFLPEVEGQIELEHLHRYLIARRLVRGKSVLDIASGEGYGSVLLAAQAASVIGVDISREAVDHARVRYAAVSNLRFLVGDCADIPLKAASVDVVVSFETIEHHARHEEMLAEIKRVLRPDGLLVISSPDRYNYSLATGYENEYHVKELYRHEFEALLARHFKHTSLLGQRVAYGSIVLPEGRGGFVSFRKNGASVEESAGIVAPVYLIALASDSRLPQVHGGLFDSPLEQSDLVVEIQRRLAERDGQVVGLTNAVAARDIEVAELRGKLDGLGSALAIREDELARERAALQLRNGAYAELEGVNGQLRREIADLNQSITLLQAVIGDRVRERDERAQAYADLVRRHEELAAASTHRDALLHELQGRLQGLAAEAEASRAELSRLRELAVAKDAELRAGEAARAELRRRVEALAVEGERGRAELESLGTQVSIQDAALRAREVTISQVNEQLSAVRATLRSAEAERDGLRAGLDERSAEAASLQQALANAGVAHRAVDVELARVNAMLGESQKQLDQIFRSKSWRMTKAVRFLGRVSRGEWASVAGSLRRYLGLVRTPQRAEGGQRNEPSAPVAVQPLTRVTEHADVPVHVPSLVPAGAVEDAPAARRRVLLVSYYCPSRSHAGGLRVLDIYALIKRRMPEVELHLYTHRRPSIDWSDADVERVFDRVFWSPHEELSAAGLEALAGSLPRYDTIDLQFHQAAFDLEGFRRHGARIVFTPMESLARFLFLQIRSSYATSPRLKVRELARSFRAVAEEVLFCFKADEVICVSRSDAAFLRMVTCLRSVKYLETGVSDIEFGDGAVAAIQPRRFDDTAPTLLYVAYFGSQTNVDALHWFLDRVHPILRRRVGGYRLQVVGRGDLSRFASFAGVDVELVGEVPRLAPYIASARVGIAPALGGSGFRGKINQYALFGVPSVVSPISAKGLAYRHGEDVLIGAAPEDFAAHCELLLTDRERNEQIGAAARATCLARYSWDAKWPQIEQLYSLAEVR